MKKTILMMALAAIYLSGCGNNSSGKVAQQTINFTTSGMTDSDTPIATKAAQAFIEACPNIASVDDDINEAKLSWASNSSTSNYGWIHPIEIEIVFSDKPKDERLIEWRAFGNHCFFQVGGGLKPGISTGKHACASVCDIPEDRNGVMFSENPNYQFLDEKTPEYTAKLAKEKAAYETNLSEEIAKAKKGDINNISNVGHLHRAGALGLEGDQYQACVWGIVKLLKMSPSVSPELTPNPNDRRKFSNEIIDGERLFAQRTCEKHLNESEIVQAIDEATELAQSIKGKTFLDRSLY